ncbi:MAG: hypoxanthine phosphoribosyltransferase [Candidatus Omnitrophota bacterium]|nr:MAG: hypoxanthine phosphoribosyltransferase [Candidatus Omnitrophota bacterium]
MGIDVLISEQRIKRRVRELAEEISSEYKHKDLLLLGILKGAFIFLADLVRALNIPSRCDFIKVRSYVERESSGKIEIDFFPAVEGEDVLLVEDIIDTGLTINRIKEEIRKSGAKSVRLCALLDKPERRKEEVSIDYLGFSIPNRFVVGYGLDYNERFRNLPYIGVIEDAGVKVR